MSLEIVCPKCKLPVKYIMARTCKNDVVFVVNPIEKTLISKTGRVLNGFEAHECKVNNVKKIGN